MLYMSTFGAAVALGRWCGCFAGGCDSGFGSIVCGSLLVLHFADLCWFDHWFIQTYPRDDGTLEFQTVLDREVGAGRIAEQREDMVCPTGSVMTMRADSILYFWRGLIVGLWRWLVKAADTNEQVFDASELPLKGLEALGVRFVITGEERADVQLAGTDGDTKLYRVFRIRRLGRIFCGGAGGVCFGAGRYRRCLRRVRGIVCCWSRRRGNMFRPGRTRRGRGASNIRGLRAT